MTYDEWIAAHVDVTTHTTLNTHGERMHTTTHIYTVQATGGTFTDAWTHQQDTEPPTPAEALGYMCHDMAAAMVPFTQWEHGFDSLIDARQAWRTMRDKTAHVRRVLGQSAFDELMAAHD